MAIELPKLPYALDALEPHVSKRTLEFHHGKHHKAYVDKTNELIANTDLADKSLEEIVPGGGGSEGQDRAVQQRRAGLESHLPLEFDVAQGRQAHGRARGGIEKDLGGFAASPRTSRRPPSASSAAAGLGLPSPMASWRSPRRPMPIRRWSMARRRSSPSMCGSMPIISITRTGGPIT